MRFVRRWIIAAVAVAFLVPPALPPAARADGMGMASPRPGGFRQGHLNRFYYKIGHKAPDETRVTWEDFAYRNYEDALNAANHTLGWGNDNVVIYQYHAHTHQLHQTFIVR